MTAARCVATLVLALSSSCAGPEQSAGQKSGDSPTIDLQGAGKAAQPVAPRLLLSLDALDESSRGVLRAQLDSARSRVEEFFEAPFEEPVRVTIHPDRERFTASFPAKWGLTSTECWMVAYGVADQLSALSPRVWNTQACEHDGNDAQHVAQILAHELTHVFHGQHNPTRDFTGAEQVGWFAEGLAVLVSGQLSGDHANAAAEALAANAAPGALESAWSGPWRYGVCGSLVQHLDGLVGRAQLLTLLAATTNAEILAAAGSSEADFLAAWAVTVGHPADR